PTRVLFDGERYDPATRQYYLRARNYDPAAARFTTIDPLAGDPRSPQSFNTYAFAQNDPVNHGDPAGLHSNPLAADIAATLLGQAVEQEVQKYFLTYYAPNLWPAVPGTRSGLPADQVLPAFEQAVQDSFSRPPNAVGQTNVVGAWTDPTSISRIVT